MPLADRHHGIGTIGLIASIERTHSSNPAKLLLRQEDELFFLLEVLVAVSIPELESPDIGVAWEQPELWRVLLPQVGDLKLLLVGVFGAMPKKLCSPYQSTSCAGQD